jgi:hypothetical protein
MLFYGVWVWEPETGKGAPIQFAGTQEQALAKAGELLAQAAEQTGTDNTLRQVQIAVLNASAEQVQNWPPAFRASLGL